LKQPPRRQGVIVGVVRGIAVTREGRLAQQDPSPRCYFFLSYARGDDSGSIQRFYNDLCRDVRDHAGLPRGTEVGFLDTHSMDLGVTWSARLMHDLARCGTFVALVSPRYVRSEMCGREWSVFANRMARHTAPSQDPPAALLPLLWLPPQSLPAVIEELQYSNDLLPPAYADKGLRQLIRLDRYRNEYVDFVDSFARQIVRTAEAEQVPKTSPALDIHQVPSAFHPVLPRQVAPTDVEPDAGPDRPARRVNNVPHNRQPVHVPARDEPGGGGGGGGGHSVRFVVAAPALSDLSSAALGSLRREPRYYGPSAVDWSPYVPELATSLAAFARDIAEEHQFTALVTDVSNLPTVMAEAGAGNQLVILLIDLWVTHLEGPRRVLSRYDRPAPGAEHPLLAVMVPASATDPHTHAWHDELLRSLRKLIGNRLYSLDGVMCRTSILSHRAFDADLRVVLERVRNQTFRTGTAYHRPAGRIETRPILQGP
jgi:FxsC-like protein